MNPFDDSEIARLAPDRQGPPGFEHLPAPLSARAWGVYCYAMTLPDRTFSVAKITEVFTEGRDALATAVDQLIDNGMVERRKGRNGNLVRVELVALDLKVNPW